MNVAKSLLYKQRDIHVASFLRLSLFVVRNKFHYILNIALENLAYLTERIGSYILTFTHFRNGISTDICKLSEILLLHIFIDKDLP